MASSISSPPPVKGELNDSVPEQDQVIDTKEHVDEVFKELKNRIGWEQKIARANAQRNLQDRPRRALQPWPGASNIRFPLSATLIRQKKPVLYNVVYNSQNIAYFRALKADNLGYALKVATLYNDIIKLYTDFETEIQYGIDALLQDGEAIFKITWDHEKKIPIFTHIENLAFITPAAANNINDLPWVCEVIGMFEYEILEKFGDVPDIEGFIERVKNKAETNSVNDTAGKLKDQYAREGISQSAKGSFITLWEKHYVVEGSRRKVTLSPDEPEFNFQDDAEYGPEFEWLLGEGDKFMYEHTKIEYKSKHMHDVMGIPEMTQEFEHVLSAIWRLKQNIMALFSQPVLFPTNAQPPGSTQNFTFFPGAIAPYPLQKLEFGEPPISLDGEMQNIRSIVEQYVGRIDFGLGDSNNQSNPRTKFELQQISSVQNLVVNVDIGNWKRFIAKILEQGWHLCVKMKPRLLEIFVKNEAEQIPPDALNGDYFISLTTSAENINKEGEFQKAGALLTTATSNPAIAQFSNIKNLVRNFYEHADPMRVEEFMTDPQQAQLQSHDKALSDLAIMLTTLEPIQAKPGDDLMTQAITAVQFQQKMFKSGMGLTKPQVNLIAGYIQSNSDALKQTNKEQYLNLREVLNQMDQAARTLVDQPQTAPPVPTNPVPATSSQMNGVTPTVQPTQPSAPLA